MVQPIDQGAILRSGAALVPNYAEQAIQRALLGLQQQEAQTGRMRETRLTTQAAQEQQRQAAFQEAVAALGPEPDARSLAMLAFRFPEFSESVKRGYDAMDEQDQRATFQSMAEITSLVNAGRFDLAAVRMRARIEADRAAGQPDDPVDNAILAGLESDDPAQRNAASSLLLDATAAVNPERYADVYGARRPRIREMNGVLIDENTMQPVAQDPRGQIFQGPEGVYELPPIPGIPFIGGGLTDTPAPRVGPVDPMANVGADVGRSYRDPLYDRIEADLEREFPQLPRGLLGAIRTRGERSDADQESEDGARTVYQFTPETRELFMRRYNVDPWSSPQNAARAAALHLIESHQRHGDWERAVLEYHGGPDENRWGPRTRAYARRVGVGHQPRRVRSVQEYNRLASGTEYIDPNGVRRRKP